MPADILFLIAVAGLALVHCGASFAALRFAEGRSLSSARFYLVALLGWLIVTAVMARSLSWGVL